MGLEQANFNLEPEKEKNSPRIVPHSETLQQEGESHDDYILRYLSLTRKMVNGEVIIEDPTKEELRDGLAEETRKNAISPKKEDPGFIDEDTQKRIDQMKKRKDLDY